jgi:hypothetical protein
VFCISECLNFPIYRKISPAVELTNVSRKKSQSAQNAPKLIPILACLSQGLTPKDTAFVAKVEESKWDHFSKETMQKKAGFSLSRFESAGYIDLSH